jgi:hypothetical protein
MEQELIEIVAYDQTWMFEEIDWLEKWSNIDMTQLGISTC